MRQRDDAGRTDREPSRLRPVAPPPHPVLALQRGAGNAAVTRMLSRTLLDYHDGDEDGQYHDSVHGEVQVTQLSFGPKDRPKWLKITPKPPEPSAVPQPEPESTSAPVKAGKVKPPRPAPSAYLYTWPGDLGPEEKYIPWVSEAHAKKQVKRADDYREGAKDKPDKEDPAVIKGQLAGFAAEDKRLEAEIAAALAVGPWKSPRSAHDRFMDQQDLALELLGEIQRGRSWWFRATLHPTATCGPLAARINDVFKQLVPAIIHGKVEVSHDLPQMIRGVIEPVKGGVEQAPDDLKGVTEKLAELEHVAHILATKELAAPVVHGAEGRRRAPDQMAVAKPEKPQGDLPPLVIQNLQVDAYYRTADGVLHADEVKATPGALADKLDKGGQLNRQIEWLKLPIADEQGKPFVKRVGYYVSATGPHFDRLLSNAMADGFRALDAFQPDEPFLRIGSDSFTYLQMRVLFERALDWLASNKEALDANPGLAREKGNKKGYDSSKVFTAYFNTLEMTMKTIGTILPKPDAAKNEGVRETVLSEDK